eukprot:scaffold116810_cov17-Tisochrysis_lutea.AAC.4
MPVLPMEGSFLFMSENPKLTLYDDIPSAAKKHPHKRRSNSLSTDGGPCQPAQGTARHRSLHYKSKQQGCNRGKWVARLEK